MGSIAILWLRLWSSPLSHNRDYNRELIRVLFKFWVLWTWENEAIQYRLAGGHLLPRSYTVWGSIVRGIPIFRGITVRYSFKSVLALSLACKPIRALCLSELIRWWKQLRAAVRNPANAQYLDARSFPIIVKLAGRTRHYDRTITAVEPSGSSHTLCEICGLEIEKRGGETSEELKLCFQCRLDPIAVSNNGPTLNCLCGPSDPDRCRVTWLLNGWRCKMIHEAQWQD